MLCTKGQHLFYFFVVVVNHFHNLSTSGDVKI